MEKTEIMKRFIHQEVVDALIQSRLDYNHPMRGVLENETEIVGIHQAYVVVPDGQGRRIMLKDRIEQLKADPRFRDTIPNPTKIARSEIV